jgi:PAS domain S-box-containing protein
VLKEWTERLVPAVRRAVQEAGERAQRRRAELDLRQSEEQYRQLFEGNPMPMWIFDCDTLAILEVNEAAIGHYGYSRREFLAMKVSDIRVEEDAPALIEYLHELLAKGNPNRLRAMGLWKHRRKDGSLIDVELRWSSIEFRGRKSALIMASDVTERRRVEQRDAILSKLGQNLSSASSQAEAARIIRAVADELFRWDAFTLDFYSAEQDRVYPFLNVDTGPSGERFEVASSEEAREPSAMAKRVISQGAELILRKEPLVNPEDTHLVGDSNRLSASLMVVPIRSSTMVIGLLSIQSYSPQAYDERDLSALQTLADHCGGAIERVRAEQALRESEQRFHHLFEASPDAIFVEDLSGKVLDVNPAGCRLHGMSRQEIVGKLVGELVPAELKEEAARNFQDLVAGKVSRIESMSRRADGHAVPIELRANRIDYAGQSALLLHVRDISEQKQLEEQLRQSQKMEAIGQLAGGVAHDFNNILTVIHGHATLLLNGGNLADGQARSAQQIAQAAERAAGLTRQLLAFGRRQIMQIKCLDLNEVVSNMTKMLGRLLGENIALQLNYSPCPALVQADAGMIEQVLLNLAVNARDAMPKGGVLALKITLLENYQRPQGRVAGESPNRVVCLSAGDNGVGIAPENLGRVFEPFFTTKPVGKGTGLGLATVYGIIKQHQGWIEVESRLGQGTTFKVFLPASQGAPELERKLSADKAIRGGNETILVVEDEAPVRDLVCNILTKHGYQILEAESGVQALQVWRTSKQKIDLVLTDMVMPDRVNGRELAEKLWAERPRLKVIFTSGYSAEAVGKDFVLQRGLIYLQKPFEPRKLALTVRDCLDANN